MQLIRRKQIRTIVCRPARFPHALPSLWGMIGGGLWFDSLRTFLAGCLWISCFLSCTGKFEEYNVNQVGFTEEQKAYDYNTFGIWMKVIQSGIYFNYDWGAGKNWNFQTMQNLSADMFSGYLHDYKPFNAGLANTVYNLEDGWNGTMWENTYSVIMTEIKKAEDFSREKYPHLYAVTQILKVELMHRVSDYYGPIVYRKFGQSHAGVMPDSQEEAYTAFFQDLDTAITLLSAYKGKTTFARFDMLMTTSNQTYEQWIRFANSLRLRLAIRIAMTAPGKAAEEARKSFLQPGGFLEETSQLVAVSALGTGYSNPLGEINKAWGEVFLNANMESILTGYDDPRLPLYFEPATGAGYAGQYRGIRQGTGFNHTQYSQHATSTITQSTQAVLMTPAEVWFLRAEAALRGWSGEDPGECYARGVESSFEQWGAAGVVNYLKSEKLPADYIDTFTPEYNIAAVCRVTPAWDEQASPEIKLEKIITQKWIACYPEGCEAWAEQRRTGYPRLFPVLTNRSNGKIDSRIMIRRLNFPVSIISSNPAQYEALCKYLGGPDTGGTRLWWDTGKNF